MTPDEERRRNAGPHRAHPAAEVLAALADTLDAGEVLRRFPGLTRAALSDLVRSRAEGPAPAGRDRAPAARDEGVRPAAAAAPRGSWPKEVVAYIDGAARGNPGEAGAGVLVQDLAGARVDAVAEYLGTATNNTAEYRALLRALKLAREAGVTRLRVYSDSELLVNQVNGRYRTSAPHLQRLLQEAIRLMREIGSVDVTHVRRELNAAADALANEAIDGQHGRR